MDVEKLRTVIEYLRDGSRLKRIPWAEASEDEFQVDFGLSSAVVGWHGEITGLSALAQVAALSAHGIRQPVGAYLNIFNSAGVRILTLDSNNVESFGLDSGVLDEIYHSAKNFVFRYDETFDEILSSLATQAGEREGSDN